ncbi:crossover junction endonuclease EME1 [Cottoperca gobio]|uniref:Crossover junction endonuclease EME1 n=1 Tax=Cottoperca gobio TaxID=56716 RepID=A0A6J2RMX3_COTGO|nr:crossover junction endonuclease EME1 [Cottoperca gobio]XP_029311362.1 crossover junction endonuclease EME1 [Cottoperca gobio]XP_029311363.1 crossover junction endonuclease EME1 [Cottoperca gobio]XP_029311364.1 crossover junction endonuclease EME1 [Cottoperca gobio]XP_029311366.1 crossover junction endonuclease EME1 [Cottoperca gobio]XP_029311367.1 crossover junction endonuclease EME1 [Cottoperca gobio]XP_029311368.1 crossover junction endonuclease EME1 [Cottoperca gobio]
MDSDSDSTCDLDEEFPVFDFLQPGRHVGQASQSHKENANLVDLASSDAEEAAVFSPVKGNAGVCSGTADVMMISSESDDDAPYVPLAQRLKLRQENVISTSSTVTNGKDAEHYSPSNLAGSRLSCQNGLSESERPLSFHQVRTVSPDEAAAFPKRWLPPTDTYAKRTAAKKTTEEIQTSREEALRRRQAREGQQRAKEGLRQEQEGQKAERKAIAEAAKALRPEECIKHMVVAVDPALLQLEGGGTLLAAVQALGCSCAIEKQALPRSVSWMRKAPCAQPEDAVCVAEAHVVMQMTVEDFITLILAYIQEERHGRSGSGPTLTSWVQEQQRRHPAKILGLVVIELEKYFRSQKSQSKKRFREAVAGEEEGGGGKVKKRRKNGVAEVQPEVSRVELEEAVVHLQLHTGVSVRFLSTWKDFSDHITMTTKAVAEAPFKREREKTGFSFYLESEWAGGQRVDRAGKGLLQVWRRQIQQLNRVSPDMASAILAAYPSPQLLNKSYSLCRTDRERISLLSELLIRRGEGVTSTTRRVGPELSKRLFLLMKSCDPQQTLDSTV